MAEGEHILTALHDWTGEISWCELIAVWLVGFLHIK